jgi:hypothetical protein
MVTGTEGHKILNEMLDKMNILVGYLKDGLVVRKLIYFIKKS